MVQKCSSITAGQKTLASTERRNFQRCQALQLQVHNNEKILVTPVRNKRLHEKHYSQSTTERVMEVVKKTSVLQYSGGGELMSA